MLEAHFPFPLTSIGALLGFVFIIYLFTNVTVLANLLVGGDYVYICIRLV